MTLNVLNDFALKKFGLVKKLPRQEEFLHKYTKIVNIND